MDIFFNAHHAPIGAFASFTLGYRGAKGGLGLELGRPANESVYVGVEAADDPRRFEVLPFFKDAEDESKRFDVQAEGEAETGVRVVPYAAEAVARDFHVATDTWTAGDLRFTIYSPVRPVPDPEEADEAAQAAALVPAVLAELEIDNTGCDRPRRAFLGYQGSDPYRAMHRLDGLVEEGIAAVGQGRATAVASDAEGAEACLHFSLEKILDPENVHNRYFGLGGTGGVRITVPPKTKRAFRFAVCFHRDGIVTSGLAARYLYRRYFADVEAVARHALAHFDEAVETCRAADARVDGADLSADQRFMLAHAIRSYYGSTQLLETEDGRPYWVVNEGEYRMMNTFDLTVDQLFYEMRMNPWTVRNELDRFLERYSYEDRARLPGEPTEHPGGLAFTHDQGIANAFSRPGTSSYECFGLDGCFSHMTHEQLVNWVLCGAVYAEGAGDEAWLERMLPTFEACLVSLENRDHADPAKRDGIMSLDSTRCRGGAEITTYDSLDASLGQARANLYMAMKTWAAYVCLERVFQRANEDDLATRAAEQAHRAAASITARVEADGTIPALFEEGCEARIIPAIEGLVFPLAAGCPEALEPDGRFAALRAALQRHLEAVLVPGVCLFEDGGWKLSSTSQNSWLSKIYLSQFVARKILGLAWDEKGRAADAAHVAWLLHPEESYWAWSDQMVAGEARGSKYYPRGVTAILWLEE